VPYTIRKTGSGDKPYCVVKKSDPGGKRFGCHASSEAAAKQIAAIEANEAKMSDLANETATSAGTAIESGLDRTDQDLSSQQEGKLSTNDFATDQQPQDPAMASEADQQDGKRSVSGKTEDARERGVLHNHEFEAMIAIDESGLMRITGQTGDPDTGPPHTHLVDATISNPVGTDLQFDTDISSSGDRHQHIVNFALPEPVAPQDDGEAEQDVEDEVVESSRDKNLFAYRPPQLSHPKDAKDFPAVLSREGKQGHISLMYGDQAGYICFDKDSFKKKQSAYKGSTFAFASSFSAGHRGCPVIELDDNGMLRHEVLRTGAFVHKKYGVIDVTLAKLEKIIENFYRGVYGQRVPFNLVHNRMGDPGALGFVMDLFIAPKTTSVVMADYSIREFSGFSLYSLTELNKFGVDEIVESGGKYQGTSAEIAWYYQDPEALDVGVDETKPLKRRQAIKSAPREIYEALLVGIAATNYPFIPRMEVLAASNDMPDVDYVEELDELTKHYGSPTAALKALKEELAKR